MKRSIVVNEIEPAPLSIRQPAGVQLNLVMHLADQVGAVVNPTTLNLKLVVLERSTGRATGYEVTTLDAANGICGVFIPGGDIGDPNGYAVKLYSRGSVGQPLSVVASGVMVVSGASDFDTAMSTAAGGGSGGGSTQAMVSIGDTAPSAPEPGLLWWESDTGNLYIWYDDGDSRQWVEVKGGATLGYSAVPSDWVTPQMYGARADGVTDDTAAIQAALNTTARHIHFPAGNYRIVDTAQNGTRTLISTLPKRRITCDGTIMSTGHVYKALQVDGDDNTIQINIDGTGDGAGNGIANGLAVYGARPIIEGCRIENICTKVFSAVAIRAETRFGGMIRGNIVRTVDSGPGDAIGGTGWGLSRAILFVCDEGDAVDQFIIENNIVTNVIGEEGDAIVVAGSAGDGVTYYKANAIIRGNTITRFNRRAIKLQASDCQTIDNTIRNDWTNISQVPNRQTVINLTQGNNHTVRGNLIENCHWFGGINMSGAAPEVFSNIIIEDNILRGVGADTTSGIISIVPRGSNVYISRNVIQGSTGRSIAVGDVTNVVIDGNIIQPSDNNAERVISVASNSTNVVVTNNVMTGGLRRSFIEIDCVDAVVANNHCRVAGVATPLFRAPDNKNILVTGNTAIASVGISNSYIGQRMGDNYAQGNPQTSFFPAPLFCVASGGPTVQFVGVYVQIGQIAFDTSPTADGKIGWVAMASGLAEAVTWKPFGAIDA